MDLFSGIWGESVLLKIDERGFEVFDETYLHQKDRIATFTFHYTTHSNIYLNFHKYVYFLPLFWAKKKKKSGLALFKTVCLSSRRK